MVVNKIESYLKLGNNIKNIKNNKNGYPEFKPVSEGAMRR